MLDISLVVPTFGRYKELKELLESLVAQDYDLSRIEVILVDQNDEIDLSPLVEMYTSRLNLVHVKSEVKGIAHSKNIGLKMARAGVVTFPDDDCTYYPDTVRSALAVLDAHKDWDVVYGKLYDREHQKDIMRSWSPSEKKLNPLNFHLHFCAITCFTKWKDLAFDERFGMGSAYAMGEELDYIMNALGGGASVHFSPLIELWHPELNVSVMPDAKVQSYAKGYGATFRKNASFLFVGVFLVSLCYMLLAMSLEFLGGNRGMAYKRWLGFTGRLDGFLSYGGIK